MDSPCQARTRIPYASSWGRSPCSTLETSPAAPTKPEGGSRSQMDSPSMSFAPHAADGSGVARAARDAADTFTSSTTSGLAVDATASTIRSSGSPRPFDVWLATTGSGWGCRGRWKVHEKRFFKEESTALSAAWNGGARLPRANSDHPRYTSRTMSNAARKLIDEALALPEEDRLEVASELLASVDGPVDEHWAERWAEELQRRDQAAKARSEPPAEWADVRARLLRGLAQPR